MAVHFLKISSPEKRHFIFSATILACLVIPFLTIIFSNLGPISYNHAIIVRGIGLSPSIDADISNGNPNVIVFPTWGWFIAYGWFAGVIVMLLRFIAGWYYTHSIKRNAIKSGSPRLKAILKCCQDRIGIVKPVHLLLSHKVEVPFAYGLVKPKIALPSDWEMWSDREVKQILLHELAHIKRKDILTNLILQSAIVFYWYNPLIWVVQAFIRHERELACDYYVLRDGENPYDYAVQLVRFAGAVRPRMFRAAVGITMARKTFFRRRIESLCKERSRVLRMLVISRKTAAFISLTAVFSMMLFACVRVPVADNITDPVMIYEHVPDYPQEAEANGWGGIAWVATFLDAKGIPEEAKIRKTSGYSLLDSAALDAAMQCRFIPPKLNGKYIPIWVSYSVEFLPTSDADVGDIND